MNRLFIIAVLLLTQHICIASDFNEDEPVTPKVNRIILETGEIIPGYADYEEFKKENTAKLLAERLQLLSNFRGSYNSWAEEDRLYYKGCLKRNGIVLENNATLDELNQIFEQAQVTLIDHMISVAACLKEKLSNDPIKQESLSNLIRKIQSWKEEGKEDIQLTEIMPQSIALQVLPQLPEDVKKVVASEPQKEIIQREILHVEQNAQPAPILSLMEAWELSAPNIKVIKREESVPVLFNVESAMSDAEGKLACGSIMHSNWIVEILRTQLPILHLVKLEMEQYKAKNGQQHPLWDKYPHLWENL